MGDWTLRTPGHREIDCASVTLAGEVYDFGTTVGPPGDSIRPALHIKFSQACASGLIKYAGKITSENTVEEIPIEDNTAIVNNIENGIKDVADSEEDIVLEKVTETESTISTLWDTYEISNKTAFKKNSSNVLENSLEKILIIVLVVILILLVSIIIIIVINLKNDSKH